MSERRWRRCRSCGTQIPEAVWQQSLAVCPTCGAHGRLSAAVRLQAVLDADSFIEADRNLATNDPLAWDVEGEAYGAMLAGAAERARSRESFVYGSGRILDRPVRVGAFEFKFLGGTLGSVAGEKVARLLAQARETKEPAVIFTMSGGARMQEGMVSLMQMPKISTSIVALNAAHVPLITVICDPTTGGVAASLAFMGDVVLAEPGALVGFAGPRVILQTIGEEMPPGVQSSDRLAADGFIDEIVPRAELRARLGRWLGVLDDRADLAGA